MTTKNIIRFTTAVLILGNLASCDGNLAQLEPELPPVEDSEALKNLVDTTFSALQPEDIVWKAEEKVAIYDGVAKREFTVAEVDDAGLAVLEGHVAAGAEEIHAVWPYDSASETLPEGGKVIVNVPAVQTAKRLACVFVPLEEWEFCNPKKVEFVCWNDIEFPCYFLTESAKN